jgi:hypothetical protein
MEWDEFESIIDSTSIKLYSTEWYELEKAFNEWKEKKGKEIDSILEFGYV